MTIENAERIEELASLLGKIGVQKILLIEETDPQLHSVTRVAGTHTTGWAAATAALTALVSYRLTMKGEEWWDCYARYFTETPMGTTPVDAANAVIDFLEKCPGAVVQREAKKKRIQRVVQGAETELETLLRDPHRILKSGAWLTQALARTLKQKTWNKTIAFAAKMAYYSVRGSLKEPHPAPWDVPIPVDLRISCITYTSGLLEASSYKKILSNPYKAVEAWNKIAVRSGIPPLNLDSLLWLIGWIPRAYKPEKAKRLIAEKLASHLGAYADLIAAALTRRECR